MELNEYYDYLIENLGVNEETIKCVTGINGYSEETLDSILYYFTGYRDLEQYTEYEDRETYREYYQKEEDDEDGEEDIEMVLW